MSFDFHIYIYVILYDPLIFSCWHFTLSMQMTVRKRRKQHIWRTHGLREAELKESQTKRNINKVGVIELKLNSNPSQFRSTYFSRVKVVCFQETLLNIAKSSDVRISSKETSCNRIFKRSALFLRCEINRFSKISAALCTTSAGICNPLNVSTAAAGL